MSHDSKHNTGTPKQAKHNHSPQTHATCTRAGLAAHRAVLHQETEGAIHISADEGVGDVQEVRVALSVGLVQGVYHGAGHKVPSYLHSVAAGTENHSLVHLPVVIHQGAGRGENQATPQ